MTDPKQLRLLSVVEHKTTKGLIHQRLGDGYVNATEMCKATGKSMHDYLRSKNTKEFLEHVSAETGIPVSGENGLVKAIRGGIPELQGTWVHPDVAIHLGQWLSPEFALAVSRWVRDWVAGKVRQKLPAHIERYMANRSEIPPTHFSMLNEMIFSLVAPLEVEGYNLPDKFMPDISMGRMFSDWVRNEKGLEPKDFPTYNHQFTDGRRGVKARLYPNELLADFKKYFHETWIPNRAVKYFEERDPEALKYIKPLLLLSGSSDSEFDQKLKKGLDYNPKSQ